MFNKIISFLKQKLKFKEEKILTVKGYYLYEYCKKILSGEIEEKDKINHYEEWLEDMSLAFIDINDGVSHPNREQTAELYVYTLKNMNVSFCKELSEIGITKIE